VSAVVSPYVRAGYFALTSPPGTASTRYAVQGVRSMHEHTNTYLIWLEAKE